MDFLNRAYGQVTDLFATMTVGARITAALLLAAVVVSLAYLFTFQLNAGDDYLFGAREFSQPELDAMAQAFGDAGLDDFEINRYRVRVPRRERFAYLQALSENNFTPQNFDSAIDDVLSSNNSWFESKQLRELRVKHATQKKLGRMVSEITGIRKADVQYDETETGTYPKVVEKKAIVVVSADGMKPLDENLVRTVRRTVCGGVAGLEPDDVTVTDLVGRRAYNGKNDTGEFGAANTVYADTKAMFEERYRKKIYEHLSVYPGIIVGVNVELNPEIRSETSTIKYDPQPTTVESNTFTKSADSKPQNGGRPGTVPNEAIKSNTPRDITALANMSTTSEESRENQTSVAGHEQTLQEKAPLTLSRVTASVEVPKSYFTKLFHDRNPIPAGQQPKDPTIAELTQIETEIRTDIQNSVESLLPFADQVVSQDRRVRVTSYTDLAPEPITEPAMTDTAMSWLSENWQTIGMFGVGLFSLIILRSMVRSTSAPTSSEPTGMPATISMESGGSLNEHTEEDADEEQPTLSRHRAPTGRSLRDELTSMVKENPDAAANVIRTWIGDAA